MGTILSIIAGAISLIGKVWGWFSMRSAQQQGADAQTGRDNATAEATQAHIAQAEADAPKSDAEVDERLKDHTL